MVGLEQIVQNKNMALAFRKFLYERYNNENFSFWLEAENFKSIASREVREKRAKEMFDKYFNSESDYELNIDYFQKKDLEAKMTQPIENDLFNAIQLTIRKLMEIDAVSFSKTDFYKNYILDKTIESEDHGNDRDRSLTICEMDEFLRTHPPIKK